MTEQFDEAVYEHIRNMEKYKEEYFNNGMNYQEAHTLCRALWDRDNDDSFTPERI